MSQAEFCYCFDCNEVGHVVPPNNGVFCGMNDGVSMHQDCHIHIFGDPNNYVQPIKNSLLKLKHGLPTSIFEDWVFSLAISLGELEGIADARGIVNGGLKELPKPEPPKGEYKREVVDIPTPFCGTCANRIASHEFIGFDSDKLIPMTCAVDGHGVSWFMASCEHYQSVDEPVLTPQLSLFGGEL